MVSLIEELETREAAARVRVEELEAEIVELTSRLAGEREVWSRLRVTRETVAQVLTELSGQDVAETAPLREPVAAEAPVEPEVRVVGAVMVPHWREGLTMDVLPDVYRDIVEVIADASGPMQAKQIVPRIGLPAVTAKIEGTRGKLKRLVERGWLIEDQPGRFAPAHPVAGGVRSLGLVSVVVRVGGDVLGWGVAGLGSGILRVGLALSRGERLMGGIAVVGLYRMSVDAVSGSRFLTR